MKRSLVVMSLAAGGLLAVPSTGLAAQGDIQRLDILPVATIQDDGEQLQIAGQVQCATETGWGLIVKATQPPEAPTQPFGADNDDAESEGVGFGGPGSGTDGPVTQPCNASGTQFQLVLGALGDAADFEPGVNNTGVVATVATSTTDDDDPAILGDKEDFEGTVNAAPAG